MIAALYVYKFILSRIICIFIHYFFILYNIYKKACINGLPFMQAIYFVLLNTVKLLEVKHSEHPHKGQSVAYSCRYRENLLRQGRIYPDMFRKIFASAALIEFLQCFG